jgi:hypothetical protein
MPRKAKPTLGRAIDEVLDALAGLDTHARRVVLRVAAFHFGITRFDADPFKDAAEEKAGRLEAPRPASTSSIPQLPVRRRGRPRKVQIPAAAGSAPSAAGVPMNEEVPDV